jgi:hypothetical protein
MKTEDLKDLRIIELKQLEEERLVALPARLETGRCDSGCGHDGGIRVDIDIRVDVGVRLGGLCG